MILATAEGAVTIIAASVPILRPLFHRPSFPSSTEPKFVWESDQRGGPSTSEVSDKLAPPITPASLPYPSLAAGREEAAQGQYAIPLWRRGECRELGY
jgi:hypothetical protein